MPEKIAMRRISEPYIIRFAGNMEKGGKDPGGYSGFVILAESHISFHTFPQKKFISLDVYSCKHFDSSKIIEEIKSIFQTDDIISNIIVRGENYPAD